MSLTAYLFVVLGIQAAIAVGPSDTDNNIMSNMQKQIEQLQKNEKSLMSKMERLMTTNEILEIRVKELEKVEQVKEDIRHTEYGQNDSSNQNDEDTRKTPESEKTINVDTAKRIIDQRSSHGEHSAIFRAAQEGPVAFCAVLTTGTHGQIGVNQPITYDTLVTNIGGGFHMAHGIFTAPQSGIYLISATVMAPPNKLTHSTIAINGARVVNVYTQGSNGFDQGTQVIVVKLNLGDDVAIENIDYNNASVYGDRYTSFSGYLLLPM